MPTSPEIPKSFEQRFKEQLKDDLETLFSQGEYPIEIGDAINLIVEYQLTVQLCSQFETSIEQTKEEIESLRESENNVGKLIEEQRSIIESASVNLQNYRKEMDRLSEELNKFIDDHSHENEDIKKKMWEFAEVAGDLGRKIASDIHS